MEKLQFQHVETGVSLYKNELKLGGGGCRVWEELFLVLRFAKEESLTYLCVDFDRKPLTTDTQAMMKENIGHRIGRMLCLLALAVGIPCSCIEEEAPAEDVVVVGSRLPDFEVTMSDGSILTGAMLREGPAVVMFFHTSCPDCQQTLPRVQRLYDSYASQGVRFALISREEGEESVATYWEANGLSMPYSPQEDRGVYERFAYRRVPRIYVSNASGVVVHIFTDDPTPTDEVLKNAAEAVTTKP